MRPLLRAMGPQDVEEFLAVSRKHFADDPPWTADQFRAELAGVPQSRWYVVAEDSGEPAGYAGLMISGETADIQTLAVAPDRQRRGIGTALLAAAIDEAERRGAHDLLLEVRADNEPALALYARHGFEQIARRRGYYAAGRADALVLRRQLRRSAQ